MAQVQVQRNKRGNPQFDLIPGMNLPDIPEQLPKQAKAPEKVVQLCPTCKVPLIETDNAVKCPECGMGKYKKGRRY